MIRKFITIFSVSYQTKVENQSQVDQVVIPLDSYCYKYFD